MRPRRNPDREHVTLGICHKFRVKLLESVSRFSTAPTRSHRFISRRLEIPINHSRALLAQNMLHIAYTKKFKLGTVPDIQVGGV